MIARKQRCIRILIADDEFTVCKGIETILSIEDDIDIVGVASNGLEAVALIEQLRPDIVLLDMGMPHLDGFEAIKLIQEKKLHTAIIALDLRPDTERQLRILESGVFDVIDKSIPNENLVNIIRSVKL